jgi:hypothetical protein
MAQIFISHSAKDSDLVGFLSKAFASTQVKAVFAEFEAILKGPAKAQRIAEDIRASNAPERARIVRMSVAKSCDRDTATRLTFKPLKAQAHAQLNLARSVDLIQKDLSEARRTDVRVRSRKLHLVECIEKFRAKIQRDRLAQRNPL